MNITDSVFRKYKAKCKKYDKTVLTDGLKKILFDEAVNETVQ